MNQRGFRTLFLFSSILMLLLGFPGGTSLSEDSADETVEWVGDYDEGWDLFEELLSEQRYEAASSLAGKMLDTAIEE